jgi:DNA ligase-1
MVNASDFLLRSRGDQTWNLPHITSLLRDWLPRDLVLDGELYVHGLSFQAVCDLVATASERVEFHVFQSIRRGLDAELLPPTPGPAIRFVTTISASTDADVRLAHDRFVAEGYEGAIIRNDAPYQSGRSLNLMKLKSFQCSEFETVGFCQGNGKDAGAVIWICETETGKRFRVLPSGPIEDRRSEFITASDRIGQLLRVRHFGRTDSGIPRHATGAGFRPLKDLE